MVSERVLIELREGARETIRNNRKLCSITEIMVLCGQQNCALHGHRYSAQIWKVFKQETLTMATFVLCSTFVSLLETLS